MTLSIGPATDYLYSLAQQAVAGVTVNGDPAVAVDGWPEELTFGMFVVGLSKPPPDGDGETSGTRSWAGLGAGRVQEEYAIPAYIDVRIGGNVQKTARDAADGLFNSFWTLLKADLTLGGVLQGGRYAEVVDFATSPENVGTVGEPGRRQLVTFSVHCRSLTS